MVRGGTCAAASKLLMSQYRILGSIYVRLEDMCKEERQNARHTILSNEFLCIEAYAQCANSNIDPLNIRMPAYVGRSSKDNWPAIMRTDIWISGICSSPCIRASHLT